MTTAKDRSAVDVMRARKIVGCYHGGADVDDTCSKCAPVVAVLDAVRAETHTKIETLTKERDDALIEIGILTDALEIKIKEHDEELRTLEHSTLQPEIAQLRVLARTWIESARLLAIQYGAHATEEFADAALKTLDGDI